MTDATSSFLVALGLAAFLAPVAAAPAREAAEPQPGGATCEAPNESPPGPVLQRYCLACHNDRAPTGGLALEVLDMDRAPDRPGVSEAVIREPRTGAMPPPARPRPKRATYREAVTWLETDPDRGALADLHSLRSTLHRLNRTESRHAVRDPLAVAIDAALLPAGNAAYGFDNNNDALTLPSTRPSGTSVPGVRNRIAQVTLPRPRGAPAPETILVPTDRDPGVRISNDLPSGSRRTDAFPYYFPADGEYLFEMRPNESGVAGGLEAANVELHELPVSIDGNRAWTRIVQRPPGVRRNERNRLTPPAHAIPGPSDRRLAPRAAVLHARDVRLSRNSLFDPDLAPRPVPGRERRVLPVEPDHDRADAPDDAARSPEAVPLHAPTGSSAGRGSGLRPRASDHDHRFAALLHALVGSDPFPMRVAQDPTD